MDDFDQVFRESREQVLAVCLGITGHPADAEDALQETYAALLQALPRFRGEAKLSTFVYRIAIRVALHVRARRPLAEPIEAVQESAPDGQPASDDIAAARQDLSRCFRALDTLGAEHRAVVALFAVDGLSHREIAEVLGVPEGTIWSRLHTARARLAAAMAG